MKYLATILTILAGPALADITLEFDEGAPKDRFIVTNTGDCMLKDIAVQIDLTKSAGKLIFDTTGSGAGVEVFQPFEVVAGAEFLKTVPKVVDGQKIVVLDFESLAPGASAVFSSDVDDTIGAREITVAGSEFSGTEFRVNGAVTNAAVVFGDRPEAVVELPGC